MSEHGTQSHRAQSSYGGGGHGDEHLPGWMSDLHNVQRTMENLYAPYEMGHALLHGANAAHRAHGATAASQSAQVLTQQSAPELAEMVETIRRAEAISNQTPAAAAIEATQAAPVLKTPSTPEMAEVVENIERARVIPNQTAQVLKTASTPEMAEMVENIQRAQAAEKAAVTAGRVLPAATQATLAPEAATAGRAASPLAQAGKGVSTCGRAMGVLGILGGGLELYEGAQDLRQGHLQQGTLDVTAGAAGIGTGLMALLGAACPPAMLAAAGLGAMAFGNKYTQQKAWWGQNDRHENRSAIDWVGDSTAATYRLTRQAIGGGVLGTLGGGLAAGATAVGTSTMAVLGDVVGGAMGAAQGAGRFASRLLHR